MFSRSFLCAAVLSSTAFLQSLSFARGYKIAVIGGGIGGTGTAYFLRNTLDPQPQVDVFEEDEVGGRLDLATISGFQYELGGSVIHPRNKHVVELVNHLGLEHRPDPPYSKTSFFDGKEIVFEDSSWTVVDLAKMAWRYGPMTLYKANKQLQDMLGHFDRIYDIQESGGCFTNLSELLSVMSPTFPAMTQASADTIEDLSTEFMREIVGAALRCDYGQYSANATKFVTFVSLAGSEGGLWAIDGGNKRLPYALLAAADAFLIPHKVRKIERSQDERYLLHWEQVSDTYDAVVVAAPFDGTLELPSNMQASVRPMEGIWVTLIEASAVNSSYFGRPVSDVIAVGPAWFNSISRVWPVDGRTPDKPVYKVFSAEKPSRELLESVLVDVGQVEQHHWLAYPHYDWSKNADASFQLGPGLWYNNAIEWAASAMEMSLLGAKNAANCAAKHFGLALKQPIDKDEL
ncbi:prenylcysteine oxidase 1-like [Cloeon dipterum]|uniref:prenylcysteine oxidase 1-like n=1 Tax=Cloeon dipterum TaxID=197152 RepID=UPI00321F66F0